MFKKINDISWTNQSSITNDGIYRVVGSNGTAIDTDDGILIHLNGWQVKIGMNQPYGVRDNVSRPWASF